MPWPSLAFALWAALLAVQDLRWQRLSNAGTWGGMAFGLFWLVFAGQGFLGGGMQATLLGLLLGFLLLLPAYVFRLIGAGDVKFLMAIGVLAGASFVARVYLLGTILALIPALVRWVRTRRKPSKVALGFGYGSASVLLLLVPHFLEIRW